MLGLAFGGALGGLYATLYALLRVTVDQRVVDRRFVQVERKALDVVPGRGARELRHAGA